MDSCRANTSRYVGLAGSEPPGAVHTSPRSTTYWKSSVLIYTGWSPRITAYITNTGGNSVSVINTATNTVTATIAVGSYPFGVAVSPDGTTAYTTHWDSNSVSVINICGG